MIYSLIVSARIVLWWHIEVCMCGGNPTYIEPSNYFSGILCCSLVYVSYVLATMFLYVYVSTWVYGLLDFE